MVLIQELTVHGWLCGCWDDWDPVVKSILPLKKLTFNRAVRWCIDGLK